MATVATQLMTAEEFYDFAIGPRTGTYVRAGTREGRRDASPASSRVRLRLIVRILGNYAVSADGLCRAPTIPA